MRSRCARDASQPFGLAADTATRYGPASFRIPKQSGAALRATWHRSRLLQQKMLRRNSNAARMAAVGHARPSRRCLPSVGFAPESGPSLSVSSGSEKCQQRKSRLDGSRFWRRGCRADAPISHASVRIAKWQLREVGRAPRLSQFRARDQRRDIRPTASGRASWR